MSAVAWRPLAQRLARLFALVLATGLGTANVQAGDALRVAYANWSSSVASALVVCAVARSHLGLRCEARQVSVEEMFASVARSDADVMLSAWLPDTHADYMKRYRENLDDLGPNFMGTRTGLVVPAVNQGRQTGPHGTRGRSELDVESIGDLNAHAQSFGGRIIGIESDTGIMRATREAVRVYGLDHFRLVVGTEASMTSALKDALQHRQPIVVTAWTPHWLFGRWALRFLDDPKGVYGQQGAIHTLVRRGLAEESPRAYALLDRFHWDSEALDQLMVWIQADGGRDPQSQVERWLQTHEALVTSWLHPAARD
jgi:glycine betaine/proline transport system substrate-binding protein